MRNKTKIILTLACASLTCLSLAACKKLTELDKLEKEGYKISVTYDANGGKLLDRTGTTVVNMFNPDEFKDIDGDGKIEISLKATDPAVVSDVGAPMKSEYSFAGWYQKREPIVNEAGEPLDAYGNVLELRDEAYYIKGTKTISEQAYNYSERWDFDTDQLVYELNGKPYSLTLYAAWVPYYKFNFYYKQEGAWTLLSSQSFDYMTTERFRDADYGYAPAVKDTAKSDYIWVPRWNGANDTGAMEHTYAQGGVKYTFPSLAGYTFNSAYTDEACTQKITDELQHTGTLAYETEGRKLVLSGVTQSVYLTFDEGEQYRITTADEFVQYGAKANASSVYTIMGNLDFTGKEWPSKLTSGEFAGKIIGNNATFKNVSASNGDERVAYGGLFGTVTADATIKDITFENVSFDMGIGTTARLFGSARAYYGVFAGEIKAGADVSGIKLNGLTLQIGRLELNQYQINLVCGNANGIEGVTATGGAQIILKGETIRNSDKYRYFVTDVQVDEATGSVECTIEISTQKAIERDTETFVAYPKAANNQETVTEES